MKSFHRVALLVGLYLCSVLIVAVPAQAQIPCGRLQRTVLPVRARRGEARLSYSGYTTCTVTNPTTYIEKVNIRVTSDGLAVAHAGDVYVGAGQDVDFQVVVVHLHGDAEPASVTGTVTEINSVPPVNVASSQTNVMVNIMQFSLVQVEAVEPFVQLMPKTDKPFEFKVTNLGNQIDFMRIGITDDSREVGGRRLYHQPPRRQVPDREQPRRPEGPCSCAPPRTGLDRPILHHELLRRVRVLLQERRL